MRRVIAIASLVAALASPSHAQLSLSNLLEAQSGRDPFRGDLAKNRFNLYEQLNLEYGYSALRLGLRFEASRNSSETPDAPGYQLVTQRWVEWSDRDLRVRAGHFNTILGRGLIHRSFELSGVILDQISPPTRYMLARDVDGVLAEGGWGPIEGRAFSGRPNSGEFSPVEDDLDRGYERYIGLVSGGQAALRGWRGARVGAAYLRYSSPVAVQSEFGSGFVDLDPLRLAGVENVQLPLYFEYAQKSPSWDGWWGFGTATRDTAALYASANLLAGPVAFSAEWKSYRAMNLGFNAPPSLVREHSFSLLNRSTHFLLLRGEEGFQLEGSWTLPAWASVTLNLSRADGDVGSRARPRPVRFEERYAEVHVGPPGAGRWEGTLFYQDGKDEFDSIEDRRVVGGTALVPFLRHFSIAIDLEELEATRGGFLPTAPQTQIVERYGSLTLARALWGSVSLLVDRTNDPIDEDPADFARTPQVEPNTFLAGVLSVRISDRQEVKLFAGERRRGLACTAGTCYVVQPFRGVELRLTTRL